MKKFVKRIISGALACVVAGATAIPAFAAQNPVYVSLYYNVGGGPQKTYDTCMMDINDTHVYYATCDGLTNGDLIITGKTCLISNAAHEMKFTSTKTQAFSVLYGDFNDYTIFACKLDVKDKSAFAQSSVKIGF